MKLTILCDMDAIVADFIGHWFDIVNKRFHGINVKVDDCATWEVVNIEKFAHLSDKDRKDIENIFHEPGFFETIPVIPGSQTALKALVDEGHDVYFLTTPANPHSAMEKLKWVEKHFPFVGPKKTIIAHNKSLVAGDIIIDDKPSTLSNYLDTWPGAVAYTIKYPYNAHLEKTDQDIIIAGHFSDFDTAWGNILNGIRLLGGMDYE